MKLDNNPIITFLLSLFLIVSLILVSGCIREDVKQKSTTTLVDTTITTITTIIQTTPRTETIKEFTMTARQWNFQPETITVNKGDRVKLHVKSIDVAHGFALPGFGINERLDPEKTVDIDFVADRTGTFTFFCSVFCGKGHRNMKGKLIVK